MNRSNLTLGMVITAILILLAAAVFLILPQEKELP